MTHPTTMKATITPEIRSVLERCVITADSVTLPNEKLANYKQVNAALEAAGGKWNKKAKCHLFPSDPREALGLAMQTGQIIDKVKARKKERQAFYTPNELCRTVTTYANVAGHRVLEPSAGHGALAIDCEVMDAICVDCIEIDDDAAASLEKEGFDVLGGDFLLMQPCSTKEQYSRIVMNPPFTRKSDAKHVRHAFEHWLAKDGLLTAIVADDGRDRQDIAAIHNSYCVKERLPAGAFKESGTMIATLIIQLSK